MAASTPTQPSSTTTPITQSTDQLFHYLSITAVIVCPLVIALPPRRLDLSTLGLLGGTFFGANQLSREYTGVSIIQRSQARFARFGDRIKAVSGDQLPPKALEVQKRLKAEKIERERKAEVQRRVELEKKLLVSAGEKVDGSVLKELEKKEGEKVEAEQGKKGMFEKIWLGGEGEDWKRKRDEREKAALEEGKGYGGLIMDQIWEVWNWGEKKMEDVKGVDEKVVAERKEGKK